MKYFIFFTYTVIFISCSHKNEEIIFSPLNPPFEEFIPKESPYVEDFFKDKLCRTDYFIIQGFKGRNKKFDNKLDSIVVKLGNTFKNKYPSYSIYFYEESGVITLNKKYDVNFFRDYQAKKQCISEVVFRAGKLYYFVYIENEKILYDYLNKKSINEIYE